MFHPPCNPLDSRLLAMVSVGLILVAIAWLIFWPLGVILAGLFGVFRLIVITYHKRGWRCQDCGRYDAVALIGSRKIRY